MKNASNPFFQDIRKTCVGTYEVTIPIPIIRMEGWKEGDILEMTARKVGRKKKKKKAQASTQSEAEEVRTKDGTKMS